MFLFQYPNSTFYETFPLNSNMIRWDGEKELIVRCNRYQGVLLYGTLHAKPSLYVVFGKATGMADIIDVMTGVATSYQVECIDGRQIKISPMTSTLLSIIPSI